MGTYAVISTEAERPQVGTVEYVSERGQLQEIHGKTRIHSQHSKEDAMLFWEGERKRIGKKEREILFKAQKGRCMYCGIRAEMTYFDVDRKSVV